MNKIGVGVLLTWVIDENRFNPDGSGTKPFAGRTKGIGALKLLNSEIMNGRSFNKF